MKKKKKVRLAGTTTNTTPVFLVKMFEPRKGKGKVVVRKLELEATQSLLNSWVACRMKCKYMLQGWEPVAQKASFRFGNLIHKILEMLYKRMMVKKPTVSELENSLDTLVSKEMKAASLRRASPGDIESERLEILKANALMHEYINVWKGDLKKDWIEVEKVFNVQFGDKWHLKGKRDRAFKKGKEIWIQEDKTSSRISEEELDLRLSFDAQSLFYNVAKRLEIIEEGGNPDAVKGVMYNIVRVPGQRWKQVKKDVNGKKLKTPRLESDKELLERIRQEIKEEPEHYFFRYEVGFPTEAVFEYTEELKAKLHEFKLWLEGKLATYKNESHCTGRYRCEFLPVCASGGKSFDGFSKSRVLFRELEE